MHLRSISLKGFKSFPGRTKLEFEPGVCVVVGPNGSGKSNITDAVLWALGEQSPLAVRGQTMQDVIFSGGHGLPSRSSAEVEVVVDNADGAIASEFSEISISRKLDRSGEGEYRLNGARCRLIDVIEVLSDTGLGKEMHSVVSQGRVEGIIHSKPADRRLLIEEAAGLGKHRKRRRRAEIKLGRTSENLARALDVEREARSRLRPLKRQAEAADLHTRLEREQTEQRLLLARDAARDAGAALARAEAAVASARKQQTAIEEKRADVAQRREAAEQAFAERSRAREEVSRALFAATSAIDRIDVRRERLDDTAATVERIAGRVPRRIALLESALERLGGAEPDRLKAAVAAAATGALGATEALGELRSALGDEASDTIRRELDRLAASIAEVSDASAVLREAIGSGDGAELLGRIAQEAARREEALRAQIDLEKALDERARAMRAAVMGAGAALEAAIEAVTARREALIAQLADDGEAAAPGIELRDLARDEADIQTTLRAAGEEVTRAEVAAQQSRDQAGELGSELESLASTLGIEVELAAEALSDEERATAEARIERLARRREQLGPVNPLAQQEYDEALERVEELAAQREDLETALTELESVIKDADRQIRESFDQTFEATARNFEEVITELFPGGRGRLRLVTPDRPRAVIAGATVDDESATTDDEAVEAAAEAEEADPAEREAGVEVEVTPAGKSMRRLSLLSGGEKSLVALAFLFAVFLARPCPFYILDEVEAALDDRNIDRFLALVRRCSDRAQFIVVTHQKRTMDAADCIYGVSMGGDGVSKVVSRRLGGRAGDEALSPEAELAEADAPSAADRAA